MTLRPARRGPDGAQRSERAYWYCVVTVAPLKVCWP